MAGSRRAVRTAEPLDAVIRRTRAGMALERALRAFWPVLALAGALWAAIAFGAAAAAPRSSLQLAAGCAGLATLGLLFRGALRFRWPSLAEARARIDAELPGRPLAALADRPAVGADDPAAGAVWNAHLGRMRALAARARAARPDLRLSRDDPWALRLLALVAVIAAALFARGGSLGDVTAAIAGPDPAAAAAGPSFEAWAEPPAYTGRPTLYLPDAPPEPALSVPAGTVVTLRVYGAPERFSVRETVSGAPAAPVAEAAAGIGIASFEATRSGSVALAQDGSEIAAWAFLTEADAAPEVAFAEEVGRAPTGEAQIAYEASDDYGVVGARAEIALDLAAVDRRHGLAVDPGDRPAIEIDLPMPITGGARDIGETLVEDFSKHPWAGLPVTVRLVASDALGQTGAAEQAVAALPGRRFYNPVAAALVEQRRDLLWSEANLQRVTQVLRAVTHRPEGLFSSERAYLATRISIRRLVAARGLADPTSQIEEVAEMLWRAALLLEEGNLGDAAERLARAQERLREALRGDASDAEIAQLMEELRDATRDYMRELAEQAIEDGATEQAEARPPGQTMTQDQIQQLMDRIQELSEQGRRAEAEALLEMLRQMLENMEMRLAEGGEGQGQGQGQGAMEDLGDALREQQNLADESFQELQRQFREGRGQGRQPGDRQGEGQGEGEGTGEQPGQGRPGGSLAERQEALRDLVEGLQGALPGEAGEGVREALRRAERQMGAARDELRQGDAAEALDRQAEAIDELREGLREMARDLRADQQGAPGARDGGEGDALSRNQSDPLGRPLGAEGGIGTSERMLPDADAAARARGLLDELRRRSGEQSRPQLELDYLRRLLERF